MMTYTFLSLKKKKQNDNFVNIFFDDIWGSLQ